jgi:hypothetical protein
MLKDTGRYLNSFSLALIPHWDHSMTVQFLYIWIVICSSIDWGCCLKILLLQITEPASVSSWWSFVLARLTWVEWRVIEKSGWVPGSTLYQEQVLYIQVLLCTTSTVSLLLSKLFSPALFLSSCSIFSGRTIPTSCHHLCAFRFLNSQSFTIQYVQRAFVL